MIALLLAALIQQPAPQPADSVRPVLLLPTAVWDGVADAPHRGWAVLVRGERIAAVVVPRAGADLSPETITEHCRERLASFKKPEVIVFAEALPRNALGKVLRSQLRAELSGTEDRDEVRTSVGGRPPEF